MTITVLIEQECNRCHDKRLLDNKGDDVKGGWREIATNKHLCPNCIHVILEEGN